MAHLLAHGEGLLQQRQTLLFLPQLTEQRAEIAGDAKKQISRVGLTGDFESFNKIGNGCFNRLVL